MARSAHQLSRLRAAQRTSHYTPARHLDGYSSRRILNRARRRRRQPQRSRSMRIRFDWLLKSRWILTTTGAQRSEVLWHGRGDSARAACQRREVRGVDERERQAVRLDFLHTSMMWIG